MQTSILANIQNKVLNQVKIFKSVLVIKNGKLTIRKLKSLYFVIQPTRMFAHQDLVLNIVFGEYWKKDLGDVCVQQTEWFISIYISQNRIGRVVSVLASSVVDRGFVSRSSETKDYKIGICCFFDKHAALWRKSKYLLARNQNNMLEWSDMSTRFFREKEQRLVGSESGYVQIHVYPWTVVSEN